MHAKLVKGDFDPEEWDFSQYAVNSDMFSDVLVEFTDIEMDQWNIPVKFSLPEEVVCISFNNI